MKNASPVGIVTGAGAGIGRATSLHLSRLGWNLVLVGRTEKTLRETASLCEGGAAGHEIVTADLGDRVSAERIVERALHRFARLDGVINNAGLAEMKLFAEFDGPTLDRLFEVNALGPMRLMLASWGALEKTGGRIVNVSSMSSVDPFPGLGTYGVSKAVLNQIGACVTNEHPDSGIHTFTVAPGATETGMLRSFVSEEMIPKGMTLMPEHVAEVIVDCVTGKRDDDAGGVILVPSPSA